MAIDARTIRAADFADKVIAALEQQRAGGMAYHRLKQAGLEVIGYGCYGAVLRIPGCTDVLKVCTDPTDGYPMYALWAQANPRRGVPDIFLAHRASPSLFVCAMPGYESVRTDYATEKKVAGIRDQQRMAEGEHAYLGHVVADVLDAMKDLASTDMHTGNFMYDGASDSYILTDPFAGLYTDQGVAEGRVTGRVPVPQMTEQLGMELEVHETLVAFNARLRDAFIVGQQWYGGRF